MFILVELLRSIAMLVSIVVNVLMFLLAIRVILSWVGADTYNEIVGIIYKVTDPILAPLKRLPLVLGPLDFSPIVAFMLLSVLRSFILAVVYQIAHKLGG